METTETKTAMSERIGRWVSYQLCRMTVALLMALVAIFIIGSAFIQAQEVMLGAYRAVLGEEGVTFAADYKTAAPMEQVTPASLDALVDKYAAIYDVDAGTLRGIIAKESSWNPKAVNPKGNARGLGQLLPSTRRKLGISEQEAHDPVIAVRAAASWLSIKKHEQRGDEAEAVQSYYCGPSERICIGKRKGLDYLKSVVRKYDSRPKAPQIVAMNSQKREG